MVPFADNMSSQVLLFHFWRAQNLSEPGKGPGGRAGLDVALKAVCPQTASPAAGEKDGRDLMHPGTAPKQCGHRGKNRSTAKPKGQTAAALIPFV